MRLAGWNVSEAAKSNPFGPEEARDRATIASLGASQKPRLTARLARAKRQPGYGVPDGER